MELAGRYDVFTSAEVHTQQAPLVFTIDGNEFELPYSVSPQETESSDA